MHTYRKIAGWNLAAGAALGATALWMGLAPFLGKAEPHSFLEAALIAFLAVVAVSIVQLAVTHLRTPSQKTALSLAVNTSVLLWIVLTAVAVVSPIKAKLGSSHWILAAAVAFYVHKRWLRPVALQQIAKQKTA